MILPDLLMIVTVSVSCILTTSESKSLKPSYKIDCPEPITETREGNERVKKKYV